MTTTANDKPRHHPATAHFPLETEKTCADCALFEPCSNKLRGRCLKHFEFRGMGYRFAAGDDGKREVGWWRGLRTIDASTPACKYFAAKE